ncbi:MAG: hypothetical protein LBH00_09965, partial [Planctomycetaceae bacterium]|nr:hypothetical protein [Planctomycetaceae bacterium]
MSLTNAFSRSAVLPVLFPAVLLSAGFAAGQTTTADYRYLPAEQRQNTAVQTLYVPNPGTAAPIQQMQYRTEFSPGMVQRFPQPDGNVSHAAQPVPVLPPVLPPADPFIGTGLPANAPTGNADLNHAANHVVPIPAQIPPFAPIQHPQFRQFDSPQQTPVAFTEAAPEPPADAARISMMPLPKPENTEQPAPVPASPSPQILPVKTNAAETATKVHRLQLPIAVFEKNLIEKLGSKFVPVRNVDNSPNSSRYRLPVRDGSEVELILDVQSNSAVITGSAKTAEACLQIVRLLDTEPRKGIVAEFVPVQQSSLPAVQRTADILNRETQRFAQANPPAANPLAGTIQPLPPPAAGNNSDNGNSNGNGNGNNAAAGIEVNPGKVLGPVQINIIDAGGMEMMNITGSPEDVQVIKNMLKQLETMSLEHEPIIELIPVKHADSLRVSQIVQQLYTQVYQQRRGSVTMLPLVKPNTILLIGKKESNDAAKELIAKLDTAVNPNASFQIFRLKHAASDTLATQMTQSFAGRPGTGNGLAPQVSIVSDFRTNSLIVQGSPRDINEAAAMIRQLDVSGSDITNIVRTFPLKNAIASELATTLTNAFAGRSGGSTTGAFGGGGATGNTGSRGAVLSFGQVDKDGNLIRGSVLYDVTVVADTRSNTLLVTAPPETMSLIEAVIRQLDQLPSAQSKIKVFQLANGDAYALTTMLTNLFSATSTGGFGGGTAAGTSSIATVRPGIEPGESTLVSVRFQTDIRTNSIIAVGSEGDMAVAEALLLRLDTDSANNRKVMLLKLINTPADQIAPILQQYVANERQIDIQNSTTILPHSPLEQYLKEINVVAEPISNSLIISTTPRYYNQIRKIV